MRLEVWISYSMCSLLHCYSKLLQLRDGTVFWCIMIIIDISCCIQSCSTSEQILSRLSSYSYKLKTDILSSGFWCNTVLVISQKWWWHCWQILLSCCISCSQNDPCTKELVVNLGRVHGLLMAHCLHGHVAITSLSWSHGIAANTACMWYSSQQ